VGAQELSEMQNSRLEL